MTALGHVSLTLCCSVLIGARYPKERRGEVPLHPGVDKRSFFFFLTRTRSASFGVTTSTCIMTPSAAVVETRCSGRDMLLA